MTQKIKLIAKGGNADKKKSLNPLTGKMEVLSKIEMKVLKLVAKAVKGDTDAFNKIMGMIDEDE